MLVDPMSAKLLNEDVSVSVVAMLVRVIGDRDASHLATDIVYIVHAREKLRVRESSRVPLQRDH